jgi:hypothetical protein
MDILQAPMQILKTYKMSIAAVRHRWAIAHYVAFVCAALSTPSNAADGLDLWLKGACGSCHGNRGQGGASSVDFPQGPSLRTSQLDAEGMFEIISCGVPGTRMYASLIGAYKDHACWGIVASGPPQDVLAIEALSADDVRALVQFIRTQIQIEAVGE